MTTPAIASPAVGSPLRRRPLFWITIALLVLTAAGVAINEQGLTLPLPSIASVAGFTALQLAAVVLVVLVLDPARRSGLALKAIALGWGGFVAIFVAGDANTALLSALERAGLESISASIAAPLNEEITKLLGVLVVVTLASPRRMTPLDGLVLGFLVGAGFEAVGTLTDRLGAGLALHALWTGITGAGLVWLLGARGFTTHGRRAGRAAAVAIGCLVVALALHALWDLPELSASGAAQAAFSTTLYLVTVAVFLTIWLAGIRDERRSQLDAFRASGSAAPPPGILQLWRGGTKSLPTASVDAHPTTIDRAGA